MSDELYQLYPSDLPNRQWEHIKEYIPEAKPGGRPRKLDIRLVLNAIYYVLVGGIAWRMLPREYPKWKSVYHYFRHWRRDGTWQRIHDILRAKVRQQTVKPSSKDSKDNTSRHKHPTAASLDSQSVKSTHIKGQRGFDSGKKIKGRKRHLLVDTLGLLLSVRVTRADVSDPAGARLLLKQRNGACKKLRLVWVDGAYRGKLCDWVTQRFKFRLQPVLRNEGQKGFVILPRRWVVERTFGWFNLCRRLSKDYEELTQTSETFIRMAMIRIMLGRLI